MDLNLLRTFVAIYEARSLTSAAESLFVTQPAVSQSLTRLRRDFHDELFLRAGRVMAPTPYADELYPTVRETLARIDSVLESASGFDPSTSDRRFRIALSELGELGYLPEIAAALRRHAPSVHLEVVALDLTRFAEQLGRGVLDLAIASVPPPGDLPSQLLHPEPYVTLMAAGHPALDGRLTWAAFAAAARVEVSADPQLVNLHAAYQLQGGAPAPRVVINRWSALPALLVSTDLIAVVPEDVAAEWCRTWNLDTRPLPFRLDPVPITLYSRVPHRDAASFQWLHSVVYDAVKAGWHPVGGPGETSRRHD